MRIFLLLVFALASAPSYAVTIDMSKIGGVYVKAGAATSVLSALSAFRGAFGPIGTAIAVGSTLQQLGLFDGISNLFVKAGTNAIVPVPSGWTDANTPPASINQPFTWGPDHAATPEAGCQAAWGFNNGLYNLTRADVTGNGVVTCYGTPVNGGAEVPVTQIYGSGSCPDGYTQSGNNCVLQNSNAVKWPSDGNVTVEPNPAGTGFQPSARDPDSPANYNPMAISRTGVDPFGNPVTESVAPNASGGLDYTRDTQGVNQQTGEPMVQRDKISTNANGTVTAGTTVTYNNSTVNNVVTNQSGAIDTSALAKEATLQKIDQDLNTKDPTAMPTIPGARTFQQSTQLVIDKFKTWFPLPTFQDEQGQCPVFQRFIPFLNIQMVIDQQCTLEPVVRPPIELAMMAAWPILAVGLFLKA